MLAWTSHLALVKLLRSGHSTGYGREFVAERDTWIGIVPVGYVDGFGRDLSGTRVRVAGEPRRVVGRVSMDALAVDLERELPVGSPVVLIGRRWLRRGLGARPPLGLRYRGRPGRLVSRRSCA